MKALLAVNGTNESEQLLSLIHQMMQEPEQFVLVHVQQPEGHTLQRGSGMAALSHHNAGHDQAKNPEQIMSFYKRELETSGHADVTTRMRTGSPSIEILKAAREEGVDLIIMGHSRRSQLQRLISGNVTKEVERNASVPVLVSITGGRN